MQILNEVGDNEYTGETGPARPIGVPVPNETHIRAALDNCYRDSRRTAVITSLSFCQIIILTISFFLESWTIRRRFTGLWGCYSFIIVALQPLNCFLLILVGVHPEDTSHAMNTPYSRLLTVGWFGSVSSLALTASLAAYFFTPSYFAILLSIPMLLADIHIYRIYQRAGDRQSAV